MLEKSWPKYPAPEKYKKRAKEEVFLKKAENKAGSKKRLKAKKFTEIRSRREKSEIDSGRRFFLKAALTAAGSAAVSTSFFKGLAWLLEKNQKKDNSFDDGFEKKQRLDEVKQLLSSEKPEKEKEKEVDQDEIALSLEEILHFNPQEPISLTLDSMESLKKHWVELYEGRLNLGLERAWKRMGFWEKESKAAFYQVGEEYCRKKNMDQAAKKAFLEQFQPLFYLSIPESHWDVWAKSSWAKGPFQFTVKTGQKYGLRARENYDERTDPEKSAAAAGQCLLDMYEAMDKDWNLVLSGYNGSFIWKYKRSQMETGEKLSYENYLGYLTKEIEEIRKKAFNERFLEHRVGSGENWIKIAQKYGCDEKRLIDLNKKFFPRGLVEGKKVFLPGDERTRRKYFYSQVAGFSENINYPAKFLAVMEVLKKREARGNLPVKENRPKEVVGQKIFQPKGFRKIKWSAKEDLADLAARVGLSVWELKKINKLKNNHPIPGKILLVPEKKLSLLSLANNNPGLAELLHKLNPAVQEVDKPLPEGIEIKKPVWNDYLVAKKK